MRFYFCRLTLTFLCLICSVELRAATSAFTFQGRLIDNGTPVQGSYDLQLKLYDNAAVGSGNQIGATITRSAVAVIDGVFTTELDFGAAAFPGADRFLEVGIKPAGSAKPLSILAPRQPITPTPYALFSQNASSATHASTATNATTAGNAKNLNNIPANQYVQTADARLTNARPPTAGSLNYIQNTTVKERANFNISGRGSIGLALGIGTVTPATGLQLTGSGILVEGQNTAIGAYVKTASGGEAVYGQCLTEGNNCYAILGVAPAGDYAGYFSGGRGVYATSRDDGRSALKASASGASSYGVEATSSDFRGGYFKSNNSGLYSLYVDTALGPTQGTSAVEVNGSLRLEGNLYAAGSKAGFVVDVMQNTDTANLEAGDVVVIVGNGPPVLGQIPVVTIRKANAAYDTAVAGVVDEAWYVPDPDTKSAYQVQEKAMRTAMQARSDAQAAARTSAAETAATNPTSTPLKPTEPEVAMPAMNVSDERGTIHAMAGVTATAQGGYVSVVTLGSYKTVKVDASFGGIRPGDLLTTSSNPGYAMKVTDRAAAFGAVIGKSLGTLDSGTGTVPILVMQR